MRMKWLDGSLRPDAINKMFQMSARFSNTWIVMKGDHAVEIPETVVRDFMAKVQDRSR